MASPATNPQLNHLINTVESEASFNNILIKTDPLNQASSHHARVVFTGARVEADDVDEMFAIEQKVSAWIKTSLLLIDCA